MRGVWIQSDKPLMDLIRPAIPSVDELWWLADSQSGIFHPFWALDNETTMERETVNVDALDGRGAVLFRPGSISRLWSHVSLDEWTKFVGFYAESKETPLVKASALLPVGGLTAAYLETIRTNADVYAIWPDGWWEIYPTTSEAVTELLGFAGSHLIDSSVNEDEYGCRRKLLD